MKETVLTKVKTNGRLQVIGIRRVILHRLFYVCIYTHLIKYFNQTKTNTIVNFEISNNGGISTLHQHLLSLPKITRLEFPLRLFTMQLKNNNLPKQW